MNGIMKIFIHLTLLVLPLSLPLAADLDFKDHAIPELVPSSQNLGMGNATLDDDIDGFTFFSNPAAKTPSKKYAFSLFSFNGALNSGTQQETGFSPSALSRGREFLNFNEMNETLRSNGGGVLNQELRYLNYVQFKNISAGFFLAFQSTGSLENDTADFVGTKRRDSGPFVSFSVPFKRRFIFGLTYAYLTRRETQRTLFFNPTAAETAEESRTGERAGSANHLTLGMKYLLKSRGFKQISLVSRHLGNSRFFAAEGAGLPSKIPSTLDASYSYWTKGRRNRWKFKITHRDLLNSYDVSRIRKIQLGIHLDVREKFAFKLGMLDSSPTIGFGYKWGKRVYLDLSSYAVNLEETENVSNDRRIAFEISIN